jgi:hypothetical protein
MGDAAGGGTLENALEGPIACHCRSHAIFPAGAGALLDWRGQQSCFLGTKGAPVWQNRKHPLSRIRLASETILRKYTNSTIS